MFNKAVAFFFNYTYEKIMDKRYETFFKCSDLGLFLVGGEGGFFSEIETTLHYHSQTGKAYFLHNLV